MPPLLIADTSGSWNKMSAVCGRKERRGLTASVKPACRGRPFSQNTAALCGKSLGVCLLFSSALKKSAAGRRREKSKNQLTPPVTDDSLNRSPEAPEQQTAERWMKS